ncbi:hypothetical protein [Sphingomonas aerophila]|uniref:Uncharacterized protein n=1 Tax=Sphingomonas aerophila TaxID=1344948 RepID=A0A7W9BBH5_9SPHN|nr:hypothetical protein [Sphingomonas aerophila]MBB5714121.1 hypothetical protein [Sphingomonas aerophila]
MTSWRSLARRHHPKPLKLGPKLFANSSALFDYHRRAIDNVPQNARRLLVDRPDLTDACIADTLVAAIWLTPLTIEQPFSIEVECEAVAFRSEDPNFKQGHRAYAKVPYSGSWVLWLQLLDGAFDAQLNGSIGENSVRIKDVLPSEDPSPMKEHVVDQLDQVRARLHQHNGLITIYNEKFDRELRTWAEAHGPMLDQIRSQLG